VLYRNSESHFPSGRASSITAGIAMTKKRVLIAQCFVDPVGGGNAVAAWALEALRETCDVTLAAFQPVDYAAVNESFGTSLREGDFTVQLAPPAYSRAVRWMPTSAALLEICLIARFAQDLDRLHRYDLVFSTQNEIDFHRRGLQYVHYPTMYLPRPEIELSWFHRIPGFLKAYWALCFRLQRATRQGMSRNLSLANSRFIADKIRQTHGTDSVIMFPPVPGAFPDVPWDQRRAGFVAVGRMHMCKRWEMAVSIIDEVRRRGHDISLTLIGHHDDRKYVEQLKSLAASRPWFRMLHGLNREELALEIARHRYGIHTMEEEHFGIAPAEIQRAGCITFVHNSGGPPEIVGDELRLTFDTVEDAAGKIECALTDRVLEERLRHHVAAQRERFTAERFCSSLRAVVEEFGE
jgi:glycosyltransferase involved in cell wall biosynthesis